jgi:hypothetical protein
MSGNQAEVTYDAVVVKIALKLTLLLAVLLQYTPMRLCAIERVALGSNCHDRAKVSIIDDHEDERTCGSGGDRDQRCICEQAKTVGNHQPASHATDDLTGQTILVGFVQEPAAVTMVTAPDPDPQRDLLASLQLPLLI